MGYGSRMAVQTGLARLASDGLPALAGKRVGLICNPTSVDAELRHAVDLLRGKLHISALFGPEHGARGDAQDMITIDDARDAVTGLPEFSLYGHTLESLTPTPAMLDHVDVMVFDVQYIGSRYYTFVWTMVLAMRACAKAGKPFVVLDRPNPIGGVHVEGPAIEPGFESFVGLVLCSFCLGLTAGEIARWRSTASTDVGLQMSPTRLPARAGSPSLARRASPVCTAIREPYPMRDSCCRPHGTISGRTMHTFSNDLLRLIVQSRPSTLVVQWQFVQRRRRTTWGGTRSWSVSPKAGWPPCCSRGPTGSRASHATS